MATFIIPLAGYPETFSIALNNVTYQLTIQWRGSWFMDIADDVGNPIISAIPLVTTINLLEQYGYLNIGGKMIVTDLDGSGQPPTYTNLGTDCILTYVTP